MTGLELLKLAQTDAQKREEEARLKNNSKLIDYYNGDQLRYLGEYLKFRDRTVLKLMNNITRKIINKKSMVYKEPPKRTFDGEQNDKYKEMTQGKDIFMKESERQSNLLGQLGVVVDMADNKFTYKMIRMFNCWFQLDPLKPTGVKYPIYSDGDKIIYEYWDEENHLFLDVDNVIQDSTKYGYEDDINKFGFIPIVWLPNDYLIDDFFNTAGNADEIINANEILNITLSSASDKFRYQSFQNNYFSGVNMEDSEMVMDYNRSYSFTDPDATIGTMGNDHNFSIDAEWIKFQTQAIDRAYNLSESWGMSGSTSGFQLIIENIDNQSDIEDMIDICRMWERNIFEIEKQIAKFYGVSIPQEMTVDFSEVKMPISQEEKNKKWQFEFDNKLSSREDYWIAENPDITDEEIEEKYQRLVSQAGKEAEIKTAEGNTIGSLFNE